MIRLAWATDLHLDFVDRTTFTNFIEDIHNAQPDALLIGGDIGEAHNVVEFLRSLHDILQLPIYVVLGNHDFYRGGIETVRVAVQDLCESTTNMEFLTRSKVPIRLSNETSLVGHDGWADAREGDYNRSLVMMNDYLLIEELSEFTKQERLAALHRLGDEAAKHIKLQLELALADVKRVFVLTHVPPYRGACWYEGTISDDEWAPHFVCQAVGRAIDDAAAIHPEAQITVLCGHTHSGGKFRAAPNVEVITGAAEYGKPKVTQLFLVP